MNPILLIAGAVALVFFWNRSTGKGDALPADEKSPPPGPAMLRVALELLPDANAILQVPLALWDQILGGRTGESFGAAAWRYYAIFVGENPDGTKRKGGTTCGIFTAYVAARAGFPVAFINRAVDDAWAPGSGFKAGDHISKFLAAARSAGWWIPASFPRPDAPKPAPEGAAVAGRVNPQNVVTAQRGDGWKRMQLAPEGADVGAGEAFVLLPGDYYLQNREGAVYGGRPVDGSHVGIVQAVSEPDAQGRRTVITIDGGDTCDKGQCARWHTRTLSASGIMSYRGTESRLVGVVRRPGSA